MQSCTDRFSGHCISYLYRDNPVEGVLYSTFSVEDQVFGETVSVDLIPDGSTIAVTDENKAEYVKLVTEWRIQKRVEEQYSAFMVGFNELIPRELVNVFDERELEVCHSNDSFLSVELVKSIWRIGRRTPITGRTRRTTR
jgi:E3 ubiquitin-protein ligase NEDD4